MYDTDRKNAIVFNMCDKQQSVASYIEIILINGAKLKTTHEREVKVN